MSDAPDIYEIVARTYRDEISTVADRALAGLSSLVEVEKDLLTPLCEAISQAVRARSTDGRAQARIVGAQLNVEDSAFTGMLAEFEKQVSQQPDDIFLLPHLDLMTAADSGLTGVTKLVMQILTSYPETVAVGFFDPGFTCHRSLREWFPSRVQVFGIPRAALGRDLLSEDERDFFERKGLPPHSLYKYTSGMNAVKLRRIVTSIMRDRGRLPPPPDAARVILKRIRDFTTSEGFAMPEVRLDHDIGGYDGVKKRLRDDILSVLDRLEGLSDAEEIRQLERLVPRGVIFHGPPGTGKTLFAKAMATEINASLQVISGPEIKSRWFGESEERIRKIFHNARRNAPAVLVFDELDAVAPRRGTYSGGSGAEHSIVNQLLTELDGFRPESLVIFVGTTNFLESIDPALLRPGRVELKIRIGHPDEEARREIIEVYNKRYDLGLGRHLVEHAVARTGDFLDRTASTRYTGDHLEALARFVKREMLRTGAAPSTELIDHALGLTARRVDLSAREEDVVAVHEAGHALVIHRLLPEVELRKVSILAENESLLGFTESRPKEDRHQHDRADLEHQITVLLGGRAAELAIFGTCSTGAWGDIERATVIARSMVEELGMSPLGPVNLKEHERLSEAWREKVDSAVHELVAGSETAAAEVIANSMEALERLRASLNEHKSLSGSEILEALDGTS